MNLTLHCLNINLILSVPVVVAIPGTDSDIAAIFDALLQFGDPRIRDCTDVLERLGGRSDVLLIASPSNREVKIFGSGRESGVPSGMSMRRSGQSPPIVHALFSRSSGLSGNC